MGMDRGQAAIGKQFLNRIAIQRAQPGLVHNIQAVEAKLAAVMQLRHGIRLPQQAEFLQPGRLAKVGIDAGAPILAQISAMAGFPEVFVNLDAIAVMLLAWLVVVMSFFVLAVQLFVTLIEFKLTTLAGFVLVPFALWNKTSFLAEKVLGNVVSSGIKVLVLAVIIGIGSTLFSHCLLYTSPSPRD